MTMANTATIRWGKYNIDIKDDGTAMVECNSLKMETTQDYAELEGLTSRSTSESLGPGVAFLAERCTFISEQH
eukprot:scaffold7481_cov166-Alexandrium_tamarense.AAC.1